MKSEALLIKMLLTQYRVAQMFFNWTIKFNRSEDQTIITLYDLDGNPKSQVFLNLKNEILLKELNEPEVTQ